MKRKVFRLAVVFAAMLASLALAAEDGRSWRDGQSGRNSLRAPDAAWPRPPRPSDKHGRPSLRPDNALSATEAGARPIPLSSNPDWTFLHSTPLGDQINRICFVNSLRAGAVEPEVWAVGAFQGAWHSGNGGLTWDHRVFGPPLGFLDIFFSDPLHGWAVGEDSDSFNFQPCQIIWRTQDGGSTWRQVYYGYRRGGLGSVWFEDNQKGWAAGQDMTLLRTTDGGDSWTKVALPVEEDEEILPVVAMQFIDADHGWLLAVKPEAELDCRQILLRTQNGGDSWEVLRTLPPIESQHPEALFHLAFVDAQTGWAAGWYGQGSIWHTTDGGESWQPQPQPGAVEGDFHGLAARGPADVWAVSTAGEMLHFDGVNWQVLGESAPVSYTCLTFWGEVGLAGGYYAFLQRTDSGGAAWTQISQGLLEPIMDAWQFTPDTGVALTARGTILRSADGWRSYTRVYQGSESLNAFFFSGEQKGWAVGDQGAVLHTADGGQNWTPQPTESKETLTGVWFVTPLKGWAIGTGEKVLTTVDGGAHWTGTPLPWPADDSPETILRRCSDIQFLNADIGWICGARTIQNDQAETLAADGYVFHTVDGGAHWEPYRFGALQESGCWDIHFFDSLAGLCLGYDQTGDGGREGLFETSDGGQTWRWVGIVPRFSEPAYKMYFLDQAHGFFFGPHGMLYSTFDGGRTIHVQQRPCPSDYITAMRFASPTAGWLFTGGGGILKTNSGGGWGKTQMALPHLVCSDAWETILEFSNQADRALSIYVNGYDETGLPPRGDDGSFNAASYLYLPPHASTQLPASAFFRSQGTSTAALVQTLTLETGESFDPTGFISLGATYQSLTGRQAATVKVPGAGGFQRLFLDRVPLYDSFLAAFLQLGVAVENVSDQPVDLWFQTRLPRWGKTDGETYLLQLKVASGLAPRQRFVQLWDASTLAELLINENPYFVTSGEFLAYAAGSEPGGALGTPYIVGQPANALQGLELFGAWGDPPEDLSGGFSLRGVRTDESGTLAPRYYLPLNIPQLIQEVDDNFHYDGRSVDAVSYYNPTWATQQVECRHFLPAGQLQAVNAFLAGRQERVTVDTTALGLPERSYGFLELAPFEIRIIGPAPSVGSADFLNANQPRAEEPRYLFSGALPSELDAGIRLSAATVSTDTAGALVILMNPSETTAATFTLQVRDLFGDPLGEAWSDSLPPKGSAFYHVPPGLSPKMVNGGSVRVDASNPLIGFLTQYDTAAANEHAVLTGRVFNPVPESLP